MWDSVGCYASTLAGVALLFASFWSFERFLPRAPLQDRAWWMVVATVVLALTIAWAWLRAASVNKTASVVRSLGVAGWLVLCLSARKVGIGADIRDFFVFCVPFLAHCYWNRTYAGGNPVVAKSHYQAKRGQLVVLAACSTMVFLACHGTMPWNVSAFVVALATVQSVGASFPDAVPPVPEPEGNALAPAITRQT